VGAANYELPGGNITQGTRQLLLRTLGRYTTVDQFLETIVSSQGDRIVKLKDVARVVDGVVERESLARYNGSTAVSLELRKQSGSNTVAVSDRLNKEIERLKSQLPSDIQISVIKDTSEFIRNAVNDVVFDIMWGGLLAVFVIFLFLANIRSTIITAIALPTSIIATFTMMYAFGFTLNMMSLLGLSLAVGLLIDDAIVVIENIYRHLHEGKPAMQAAKEATGEIGLAVMAVTFTLVAVFVPVAFMQGIVGRFFKQFGLTISVAVIVSLFVAFTLTPMLSSRWLRAQDEDLTNSGGPLRRILYWFNHGFNALNGKYQTALKWSLTHRKSIVTFSVLVFFGSLFLFKFVGSEFFPSYDRGEFIVSFKSAPGSSLEQTDVIAKYIETSLRKHPEVVNMLTSIGAGNEAVNSGSVFVKLVAKKERVKSSEDIQAELRNELSMIPGATISFGSESGHGGSGKPFAYSVRGPEMKELIKIAAKIEPIVKRTPGAVDVESSLEASKPELVINIDRSRASDLGVNVQNLAGAVRSMVDGYKATKYYEGDEQYDVRVRLRPEDRSSAEKVAMATVMSDHKGPGDKNILVRLGDIARIEEGVGPSQINRYDRQKEIQIGANLSGALLGDVMKAVSAEVDSIPLPPGYKVGIVGEGEIQAESFANIFMSLALAIIFVYIILAMQFESFLYPLSIMLSLPMAIVGAVISLILTNGSLSIMSMIGIIMLMGLVTKNAILLVDYTNTLRGRGMSRLDAQLRAGPVRLRPILMTTFAMIFGMLPVALGLGEGSEFRAPMGVTVIGGLVTSTLLTLFVVPVFYSILDDMSWKRIFSPITRLIRPFVPAKRESSAL
jgi:hydrophobe/amphiphile efflux-1 (HAE1) family protein